MPTCRCQRFPFVLSVLLFLCGASGAVFAERTCLQSLQSIIDAARLFQRVHVPACVYRESVTIHRPVQLIAEPGAEIRGSDVWSTWIQQGNLWRSVAAVPPLPVEHGICGEDRLQRCLQPEQVFIDGQPLEQVVGVPGHGQFAVDGERHLLLGQLPLDREVEVTVRRYWVHGTSDDVGIHGFRMRHAANDAQWLGALSTNGHSRWVLTGNVLSDAHGALVSLCSSGGRDNQLRDNELFRSGWLAVHGHACDGAVVSGNDLHHNNTEGFSPDWAAGGIKMAAARNVVFSGNRVHHNQGHGLWCDIDCENIVYERNVIHDNAGVGVFHEISGRARIQHNRVWNNGWRMGAWGTGAGILVQGSRDVRIVDNTLAWNADGIVVVSTKRHEDPDHHWNRVTENVITGNLIVMDGTRVAVHGIGPHAVGFVEQLPWLDHWSAGVLLDARSGNFASNNTVAGAGSFGSSERASALPTRQRQPAVDFVSLATVRGKLLRAGIPDRPGDGRGGRTLR